MRTSYTSYALWVSLLMVSLLFAGCRKPATPNRPTANSKSAPAEDVRKAPVDDVDVDIVDIVEPKSVAKVPDSIDSVAEPVQPVEPNEPIPPPKTQEEIDAERTAELLSLDWEMLGKQSPPDEAPRHAVIRMVLLASNGPLICDVKISIGDAPFDEPLKRLVRQAHRLADSNRDGKATWDELLENPRFRAGQYGNAPIEDGQEDQFRRMYDADLDGIADLDELPRVMTRNSGRARSFYHRSANYFLTNSRINSVVRKLIDVDRDGRISTDESKAAAAMLYSRDANEDQILRIEELSDPSPDGPIPLLSRRINSNPDPAISLYGTSNWGDVLYAIRERYEAGYSLAPSSFSFPATLYKQLDADDDDKISKAEAEAFGTLPPHLELVLNFGSQEHELVEGLWLSDELQDAGAAVRAFENRVILTVPGAKIEFFANDTINQNAGQRVSAELARLDKNQDGYVAMDEVPEGDPLAESFNDFDQDGDEKLYPAELQAAFELQASASAGQIRGRTGFFSDAMFSILDADHNGRLTPREIEGLPKHIHRLDQNQDGSLSLKEIPDSMLVGFVRGDPQQDDQLFQPPRLQTDVAQDGPRWFRAMDRNGDNELTRSEFLGDREQFRTLDLNQDSFIDSKEAARESSQAKP